MITKFKRILCDNCNKPRWHEIVNVPCCVICKEYKWGYEEEQKDPVEIEHFQLMEKLSSKAKSFLVSKIRLCWRFYSEARKEVLKTKYCVQCKKKRAVIYADHIVPVGSFVPEDNPYLQAMFCPRENLQGLCEKHHDAKTKAERQARKKK